MSRVPLTLAELARLIGAELRGDPEVEVRAVRVLDEAGPGDLSFLTNPAFRPQAEASSASALLVPRNTEDLGGNLLLVDAPELALARVLEAFHPPPSREPGIHPSAVVAASAVVHPSAHLGPYVVVGEGSKIGADAALLAHVVVGRDCAIGAGATLHPQSVLYDRVELGEGAIIHAGAVLGADGFGYTHHQGQHVKIPQVGRTLLGAEVEIGANSTVDRAMVEETSIGAGSKIDNLVQVGHNVRLGQGCMLSGQAGIAGSAKLGNYVVMGGQAGVGGHLELGDGVQVAAKSAVFQSVEAGTKVGGIPATKLSGWRRQVISALRLPEMLRRLRALERRLSRLEADS